MLPVSNFPVARISQWYSQLSRSEMRTLNIALITALVLFVYSLIWQPLHTTKQQLAKQVSTRSLQLQELQQLQSKLNRRQGASVRLTTEQQYKELQSLSRKLSANNGVQVQALQLQGEGWQLDFSDSEFTKVLDGLAYLQRRGIFVHSAALKKGARPGAVSGYIIAGQSN